MTNEQFVALFEHLDTWLPENGCDHTLRESMRSAKLNGVDPDRVYEVFPEFGAGCDCEVILNMEELAEEAGLPPA